MISHLQRHPGRGSYIDGKSIQNQRVERLWRDMFYGVTGFYHENRIWALQYTFLLCINHALKSFADGWNSYPLSSARN